MRNKTKLHNDPIFVKRKKHKLKTTTPMDYILAILIGIIVIAPFYILIITSILIRLWC